MAREALRSGNTESCAPAYILSIASIVWASKSSSDLSATITTDLFDSLYNLIAIADDNLALKYSLDSILCAFCYTKAELFPRLLQHMKVLVPNLSTDPAASISDDRKDSKSMTDDSKQNFANNSEWYERLVIRPLSELYLTDDQLETIALVSRSPTAIQQLLDSGLPKLLSSSILEYCQNKSKSRMAQLDKITAILKFFADVSEEKVMRDWLGSSDASMFWSPLLNHLCKRTFTRSSTLKTEAHSRLEEVCVRFLSRCCLCHISNQTLLAKVLCEVISEQTQGITGFMRRLILQLLLENEKVPVCVTSDETVYKTSATSFVPIHPAFKQNHNTAFLYLGTNVTLADILDHHISFTSTVKSDNVTKKESSKNDLKGLFAMAMADSDLSMAAGVTAKDKRAKDAKNQIIVAPKLKKKRYTVSESSNASIDVLEGKIIKCDALPYKNLSFHLTLAQVLRMMEEQPGIYDWPCVHLAISQNKCRFIYYRY